MSADRLADGDRIAAVDRAIARLSTDVGRLDAIDLDAPWDPSARSRRALLVALVESLDGDSVPDDTSDGWPLANALVAAWGRRRDVLLADAASRTATATVEILAAIHDVHVALDVGVRRHDLQPDAADGS